MYIPLFNKTTYTFLSSLLEVDDLIKIAKDNNLKAIGICDDNMYGSLEFIKKCEVNNIKPIVGVDFKTRLLYAKNYQGYQNLLKLINIQSEKELSKEDFNNYKDNLICIPFGEIETEYETIFYPLNIENSNNQNVIFLPELLYKNKEDA